MMKDNLDRVRLTKREKEALLKFKHRLEELLGKNLLAIKLFGSRVRGRRHRGSDIDVVVIVQDKTEQVEDIIWDESLEAFYQFEAIIEAIVYSLEEYKKSLSEQWPFMLNLEREGISIL